MIDNAFHFSYLIFSHFATSGAFNIGEPRARERVLLLFVKWDTSSGYQNDSHSIIHLLSNWFLIKFVLHKSIFNGFLFWVENMRQTINWKKRRERRSLHTHTHALHSTNQQNHHTTSAYCVKETDKKEIRMNKTEMNKKPNLLNFFFSFRFEKAKRDTIGLMDVAIVRLCISELSNSHGY